MAHSEQQTLTEEHTPWAIRARLDAATRHSYLRDFVIGAMDGAVTTFAIVAGVAGAGLSSAVAIVLGLANLLADGFSMAAGNYLSTRTERELVDRARRLEERHIEQIPAGEREEVRQIFAAKGFAGDLLEEVVRTITQDRRRWVDTMLTEEHGLRLESPSPAKAATVTFAAFCVAGAVPLLPLVLVDARHADAVFAASSIATAVTFLLIGLFKGRVLGQSLWFVALETLAIGACAAAMAFAVGHLLRGWIGA